MVCVLFLFSDLSIVWILLNPLFLCRSKTAWYKRNGFKLMDLAWWFYDLSIILSSIDLFCFVFFISFVEFHLVFEFCSFFLILTSFFSNWYSKNQAKIRINSQMHQFTWKRIFLNYWKPFINSLTNPRKSFQFFFRN